MANGENVGSFDIRMKNGSSHRVGDGQPAFTLMIRSARRLSALNSLDEPLIARAYMDGDIDIVGDMERIFAFRGALTDRHPLLYVWYVYFVNMGVTEHLPDYRRTLDHYARLLKPGGRVFIDASTREVFTFPLSCTAACSRVTCRPCRSATTSPPWPGRRSS